MTIQQIRNWSPDEKRQVVAAACGWSLCSKCSNWHSPETGEIADLPDYLNDLNAMLEAEKHLKKNMNGLWYPYCAFLHDFTNGLGEGANAGTRADAFIVVVAANLVPDRPARLKALWRAIKRILSNTALSAERSDC